ncbi:uncharacterized protein DMAD_05955 [Drosophila madeirensis]|uniref:Uncharacterized protein n=1 Tax=Drosophila madeirensis TaxID=30013 RepID=A0AAU9FPG5_DROMD
MDTRNQSNIVNLPPQQLSLIYKFIVETEDKLSLAQTHPVLSEAFKIDAGNHYELLDLDSLPVKDWPFIFSACGSTILGVMSYKVTNSIAGVMLAAKYCPNRHELFIAIRSKYWKIVKRHLDRLKKVDYLRLMNDYTPIDLMKTLLELPNLKTLKLARFNQEDLMPIKHLQQLQNLFIKSDYAVNMFQLCSTMSQLESLEITCASIDIPLEKKEPLWPKLKILCIGIEDYQTEMPFLPSLEMLHVTFSPDMELSELLGRSISDYSKSLQELRLNSDEITPVHADNAKTIGQLKSLKSLICSNMNNAYLQFIKLDQLQMVILQTSNNVTNSEILRLLRGCKNLRSLDVSGCRRVNKNVVAPLLKILKQHDVQPDDPLVLTVNFMSFGDAVQTTATDPNNNLLLIQKSNNIICERPYTALDASLEIEDLSDDSF